MTYLKMHPNLGEKSLDKNRRLKAVSSVSVAVLAAEKQISKKMKNG